MSPHPWHNNGNLNSNLNNTSNILNISITNNIISTSISNINITKPIHNITDTIPISIISSTSSTSSTSNIRNSNTTHLHNRHDLRPSLNLNIIFVLLLNLILKPLFNLDLRLIRNFIHNLSFNLDLHHNLNAPLILKVNTMLNTSLLHNLRHHLLPLRHPSPNAMSWRRRRDTSSIACNMCRTKKTACDRVRPSCALCIDRGTRCVYRANYRTNDTTANAASEALQRQLDILQTQLKDQSQMVQALAALPPEAAVDILRLLRTTKEPFSVLSGLQGNMHARMRPSDYRASRSMSPPTLSHLEFELAARYRAVYARLEPVDDASLQALILPGDYTRDPTEALLDGMDFSSSSATPTPSSASFTTSTETPPPRTPPNKSRFIDDRLQLVQIEYWTSVPISNSAAASILSFYLEYDHTLFNTFDADLFLSDLVECRSDFCSAFLVNSILFFACQAYTAIDAAAAPFVHAFFRESVVLWSGLGTAPSLTSIAACEIFSMGGYFYGRDDQALEALTQGRRMAEKLELLSIPRYSPESIRQLQQKSSKWLRAAAHTAWGVHNWLSAHVFYYNGEAIHHPPLLPAPGSTADQYGDEFTKVGRTIEWSRFTSASYPGISQFWVISQEVAVVYLNPQVDRSRPLAEQVPMAFAEEKYRKLLEWADSMVDVISDRQSWQLMVCQCWFHCTVMHIFRPFLHEKPPGDKKSRPRHLRTFTAMDGSPETVFDASVEQLKNLSHLYLSNLSRIPLSGFFNAAFVVVGHAMIQRYKMKHRLGTPNSRLSISSSGSTELPAGLDAGNDNNIDIDGNNEDEEMEIVCQSPQESAQDKKMLRLYFLLCVRAWTDLYICFPTFSEFTQAFLSMAMEAEILTGAEAQSSLTRLRANGRHHEGSQDKPINVSSLIDFDKSLSRPEEASVNTLAQRFNDLATFSELTNAEDFVAVLPDEVRIQEIE
ncbi:hypothetical protein SBRCBS47491_000851 [Sporothrix bragantina]|uniref:Zn(2)-C6 fungal-type domain-containing protein n=1 Tax=Sporothrix bragantina TaxID=671064 RepID=A0ABP0ATU5_9PEZI